MLNNFDNSIYKQIVESNWVAVTIADLNGILTYTNKAANELYGYENEELIGKSVDIFNADENEDTNEIINAITEKGGWSGELTQRKKDNTTFDALLTVWLIKNEDGEPVGLASNSKDISQQKLNEKKIKETLKEKELLLNEIHHRVKNNLTVISSLLQLEEIKSDNKETKEILTSSQNRIKSTALVHQFLYQNDSIANIQFKEYLEEFISQVSQSLITDVEVITNIIGDQFNLDIEQAIPCGLIINELYTNSIKHAFKGIDSPSITITLHCTNNNVSITYEDNGIGIPTNVSTDDSLGMIVIQTLVKQLKGKFDIHVENGTKILISFVIK